jgi:hypothetical protein
MLASEDGCGVRTDEAIVFLSVIGYEISYAPDHAENSTGNNSATVHIFPGLCSTPETL